MDRDISMAEEEPTKKIFNDPIHGHIELHPACIAIVDTPQFQRLRFVKQLALCYFVYPGACHNRFEHSIGVCYLAGQLARSIQRQPNLEVEVTDVDVLCVEIAGLCHDLGHGPFSHLFDNKFLPAVDPQCTWKHEKGSQDMLDHLIWIHGFMEQGTEEEEEGILRRSGLTELDIVFIKELIDTPLSADSENWPYRGRPREKGFLYEVVSNKRNGIDVDKWEYFARDSYHLGINNSFDHMRFIKFARVLKEDNQWQICVRDKEIRNIYNMFYTRYMLHKMAYQHPVNHALEEMMCEALLKANDHIKIGRNNVRMSDCVNNMDDFLHLHDNVMFKILESEEEALKESREIVQRIIRRDLYTCVASSPPLDWAKGKDFKKEEILDQIHLILAETEGVANATRDHVLVVIAKWDFGMKDQNPIDTLRVFSKYSPEVAVKPKMEHIGLISQPMFFKEIQIRVYSRSKDPLICDRIKTAFQTWMQHWNLA